MTSGQAAAIFKRSQFVGRNDAYLARSPLGASSKLDAALTGTRPVDVSGSLLSDPYVQDATSRIGRYNDFTNFYAGRHHTVEYDMGDLKPVFNFPRRIVNKRAAWITGKKGFQFVPRKGNEMVAEVLDEVWLHNRKKSLIRRTAKVALVTGDAFLYISVKTSAPDGKELPRDKWSVRICPINPAYVFPLWMESDPNVMRACMIQFPIVGDSQRATRLFTAVYTAETVEMYLDNEQSSKTKNVLGCIPIVHVCNSPYNDLPFGISALADVLNPVKKYNEVMMQIGRIVKYHSDPTTIVYGTAIARMERAANRVWSNLPPPNDAKVENLEMRGDLAATYKLAEEYRDEIHVAACTPQIAYEARQLATSNSSGLAIQLLFQPLIEATEEAHDEFDEAITAANKVIAAIYDKIFGNPLSLLADDPSDFLRIDIKWPPMLPRDEAAEVTLMEKKLAMGIISKAEAARRIAEVTDTERAALEIAADRLAELAIDAEKARALQGQQPNFVAVSLGSLFMNEELLDIAKELGQLTDTEEKTAGDTMDDDGSPS